MKNTKNTETMKVTDLETQANEINAYCKENNIPLFASAGKRAIKFFKEYVAGSGAGYQIGKAEAMQYLSK